MKVSESSPDRFVIEDIPWIRGILIILCTLYVAAMGFREWNAGREAGPYIVLGAIVAGPIFFALFVERYQVLFLKEDQLMIHRKRSVFGYKEDKVPLSLLSHATVEESTDSDGHRMYQPVLVMPEADKPNRPLVDYSTNAFDIEGIVVALNDWLEAARG